MSIKPLLKSDQVAELFGISTDTLSLWRREGKGPNFVKMGSFIRYRHSDVEAHMKRLRAIELPNPQLTTPTPKQLKEIKLLKAKLRRAKTSLQDLRTQHKQLLQQHQAIKDLHTELEEEHQERLEHEVAGAFVHQGTLAFFVYRYRDLHHDERGNFLIDKGKRWKEVQTLQHATESL